MKTIFPLLLLFALRSALLSNFHGSIILSSHSDLPTEGNTVELTCNITSTTSPATNTTKLYYRWRVNSVLSTGAWSSYPTSSEPATSSGPAVSDDGNRIPGYGFKNVGRTFVIHSVRYYDKGIDCQGSEDGETYEDTFRYCLQIKHKPYINYIFPPGKKVNAAINKIISMKIFECEAYPSHSPKGRWTFVNLKGVSQNLPPNPLIDFSKTGCVGRCSLRFNFTSVEYYGNYSFTMTNDMGSATVTFQVLPEGPPDAPSNVRIETVTHNTIVVEWKVMWPNSIDQQQTVCWQLTQVENGIIVESSNASYDNIFAYNSTHRYRFDKTIETEANYKVSVWSMNKFGKSKVVEIEVEREKGLNLIPRTETISINKTEATVNFPLPLLLCLSILLGIMSTALIAVLVAYLVKRFNRKRQPQQPSQMAVYEANAGSPQSNARIVYDYLNADLLNNDDNYTYISDK